MKIKNILAAIAASAVAVSAMAVSASALADNQKAYGFGGAQVNWDVDLDGDEDNDVIGGVNGDQWIGTLDSATGSGTIKIPCTAGDTVEIICQSWDSITDKVIFTATVDGTSYDCYYNQPVSITVPDSVVSTLEAQIQWAVTDGASDGTFNDWCGNYVIVTTGGASAAADTGTADTGAADTGAADTTTSPTTGNVPAAVMVSVMAVAGTAAVISRKRK